MLPIKGLSDKKVSSPTKGVILILAPSWQNGAIRTSYKKALFLSISMPFLVLTKTKTQCQNNTNMHCEEHLTVYCFAQT